MRLSWLVAVALTEPPKPYQDLDCDGIPNPIDWRTTPPTPLAPSYTGPVEQDNAGDARVTWPETRRLGPDGTTTCSSDEGGVRVRRVPGGVGPRSGGRGRRPHRRRLRARGRLRLRDGGPWDGWWAAWTLAAAMLRRRNAAVPEAAAR
jgi:hypothetical protein